MREEIEEAKKEKSRAIIELTPRSIERKTLKSNGSMTA